MYAYLVAAALPALAAAHGHVAGVIADGVWYTGWDAAYKYSNPIPKTVGWQADNLDNGFVTPSDFGTANIACHKSASSNGAYATIKAGSPITFFWNTWPATHKGPIIDYLAPVSGDFSTATPASLSFTKIAQGGWKTGSNPGTWVTDDLVARNNSWTTTIPASLAPGNYVIRHEIIALHAAANQNGAQSYPQCINLKVTGSGTAKLTGGAAATTFYKANGKAQ